jgi:hypothetical protein
MLSHVILGKQASIRREGLLFQDVLSPSRMSLSENRPPPVGSSARACFFRDMLLVRGVAFGGPTFLQKHLAEVRDRMRQYRGLIFFGNEV